VIQVDNFASYARSRFISKKILIKLLKAHENEMKSLTSPLKEGMALALISQAKSKGIDPDQMAAQQQQLTNVDEADRLLQILYEEYEQALKQSNSLDFDDLLRYGVKLFDHKPNLAHWCRHILVDELLVPISALMFVLLISRRRGQPGHEPHAVPANAWHCQL
jgi:superfamily I DNA/RNA helicase